MCSPRGPTQSVRGYLGVVANEARTTSLVICSEHNEVRVAIDRRRMRLVRRVDIVKCLMKNDKKVDD